jgi:peptidoglycan/LPS O-acetylase OafA/YrhL
MTIKNQELAQLNFFRGLAALYVLVGHCAHIALVSLSPLPGPGHAVDFFMLMSGFLMSLNFHERKAQEPWGKTSTFIRFYIRRFFRIAPLYYFIYLIIALYLNKLNSISTIRFDYPIPLSNTDVTNQHYIWSVFLHLTFLFGLLPSFAQDNILPDWSIGLEMQFYAIFPFIMLLMNKIGRIVPILLFTAIYLSSSYLFGSYETPGTLLHFGQPSFLPLKINVFLLGIFLGESKYFINHNEESKAMQLLGLTFILSFIGNDIIITFVCCYFVLWIGSLLKKSPLFLSALFVGIEKKCNNKFTTFFSNTSFSVYLLHLVILYLVNAYFVNSGIYSKVSSTSRFTLLLVICLPIIYFISYFLYKFIEYPFIKIGKKLLNSFYQNRS